MVVITVTCFVDVFVLVTTATDVCVVNAVVTEVAVAVARDGNPRPSGVSKKIPGYFHDTYICKQS